MIIDISLIVAKKYGIIFDKREGRIMPYNTNIINSIINEARKNMVELPWIEFKENYTDPQGIGEYISALSNTAALFNQEHMTNATLRERFKIEQKNSSMISRLLNETCAIGLIKISDDSTSDKNRKYLPFWA